jgi:membrane-associated phospholipid phosphatase
VNVASCRVTSVVTGADASSRLRRTAGPARRRSAVRPVDRVVAAYNLLLAGAWALAASAAPHRAPASWWVVVAHLTAALLLWLVHSARARVAARVAGVVAIAIDVYPLLMVAGAWTELGSLLPLLHPRSYDRIALWLDGLVFGTHWHLRWVAGMPWPWLSEIMYAAYFSLYPMLACVPVALVIGRHRAALRDYVFSLTLTYLGCCVIYLWFPVVGPAQFVPHVDSAHHGLFFVFSAAIQQAGDSLGTSCPSTHVAASATIALVAWRRFPRPVALVFVMGAVMIALATVYTQNHYAVDVVAGYAVVLALQSVVAPALEGGSGRTGSWLIARS